MIRTSAASAIGLLAFGCRLGSLTRWCACIGDSGIIHLRPPAIVRLTEDSNVERIEILRGTIGITEAPSAGERLFHAGSCFRPTNTGPVVLQARADTEIILRRHKEPNLRGVRLRL